MTVPLARHRDFRLLWIGQSVSVFGSLITRAALPFAAVLVFHIGAAQAAGLVLCDLIPGLLVGVVAGPLVDRLPRRPVMLLTDILRGLAVAALPAAAFAGVATLSWLYVVAALVGALSTLFDIAYGAYLPTLVEKEQLPAANARLSASGSVAEIAAFALAGWLVTWLTPPFAFLVDAATFGVSALTLAAIRTPEPSNRADEESAPEEGLHLREALAGVEFLRRDSLLRALAFAQIALLGVGQMVGALYMLFVTRTLGFTPGPLGMIFAIGGVTSLLGALAAPRLAARLGTGRAAVLGYGLAALGTLTNPLAPARRPLGLACLALNQLLTDPGWTLFEIHATSIRQGRTPSAVLGRVNAAVRVGALTAQLTGTALAGLLGERIGPRATLGVAAVLLLMAAVGVVLGPIRRVNDGNAEERNR